MLEAVLVFANEILVCFLFPIHISVHRIYHIFTTIIHNGVILPLFASKDILKNHASVIIEPYTTNEASLQRTSARQRSKAWEGDSEICLQEVMQDMR